MQMNPSKPQPFVSLLVALASKFIIGWGIKSSAAILNPILLAAVITIVVLPMPQNLTKRGLPGWLSFVLTLLIEVGGLAAVVLLIGVSFANMGSDVSEQMPDLTQYSYLDISNTDFIAGIISSLGTSVAQMFMVMLIFIFMLSAALATPGY
jgi:predicted PurR-regulated permease PerM